ncbi:hypothetical protein ACJ2A9_14575 [Anaerobacillus sp. MEB173]
MAKDERLNEEGAMNNNLSSSTLLANEEIRKEHKQAKVKKGK